MRIKTPEEEKRSRKASFIKDIIYIVVLAIVVYFFLYGIIIDRIFNKYVPDQSLYVEYNLGKDLIPDPIQKNVPEEHIPLKIRGVDLDVKKLASYDITGKVEAIKEYNTNPVANFLSFAGENVYDYISPIDLTLSWGKVALYENSNHFYSNQYTTNTYRMVMSSWDEVLSEKLGDNYVKTHFSNNHLISLDKGIRDEFSKIKEGQIVRIQGYLVYVVDSNGGHWGPSSLVRDDNGCEIIYVEKFINMDEIAKQSQR